MPLGPLVPIVKNQKKIVVEGWQEMPEDELASLIAANNGGNIGVRLDRYAVLDPDEPAAEVFANDWEKKGILTPTVAWKTARGFTKRLYKRPANWPFESNTVNVPNMKIQLRSGAGVQDVIPPSVINGNKYAWIKGCDPDSLDPADLPQEILVHFLRHSQPPKPILSDKTFTGDRFDIESYLIHNGVEIVKVKPFKDGTIFGLRHCVFNPDHTPNDAAIFQAGDGKLSYQCFHDTCQGRTWHEARVLISGQKKISISRGKESGHINNINSKLVHTREALIRGLRENRLTPEEKTYIIELIEKSISEKTVAERVREWVFVTDCDFNVTTCDKILGFVTRRDSDAARQTLIRMKNEGLITNVGRRGWYRRVEGEAIDIDFGNADTTSYLKIEWPFRLHQLVKIFPRNLIVLAGVTNAGKTAFLLEFCRLNMDNKERRIKYISTEMDDVELRDRLDKYAMDTGEYHKTISEWKKRINFKLRYEKIIDIVDPNAINIIDYYSPEGEFYEIGDEFKKIHMKLDKGIAIIAIQKKADSQVGYGGPMTEQLPRVAINIDPGRITIKKAKNLMPGINRGADGFVLKYKLAQGYKWMPQEPEKLFWWWNYKDVESETLAF